MPQSSISNSVDLSRLPAPQVVEALDFETIFASMLADLLVRLPTFDATVESDPALVALEVAAYRELMLRQRVNDAARAVMPAFATGADLDQLAALLGVARLLITAADPLNNIADVFESDDDLRRRLVLAPEGYSVAGPEGAYIFHALSSDARVLDASAISPNPGEVLVTILSRTGDGAAPADLVAVVAAYLSDEMRRPMTDFVTVQSVSIVPYAIEAMVLTFSGPDPAIVLAASRARLDDYVARSRRLGRDVTRAGVIAALGGVEGVQNVLLTSPAADVVIDSTQAAFCTGIAITSGGVAE